VECRKTLDFPLSHQWLLRDARFSLPSSDDSNTSLLAGLFHHLDIHTFVEIVVDEAYRGGAAGG
jgi:hypothetical protein